MLGSSENEIYAKSQEAHHGEVKRVNVGRDGFKICETDNCWSENELTVRIMRTQRYFICYVHK